MARWLLVVTAAVGMVVSGSFQMVGAAGNGSGTSPLEQSWQTVQASNAPALEKVENTASTYFEVTFESRLQRRLFSPAFLMVPDTRDETYRTGRLDYFFAGWKAWGSWLSSYSYNPAISNVIISGNSATLDITPFATERLVNVAGEYDWPATDHRLTLEHVDGSWLVVSDVFSDDFLARYGSNPDWNALIAALPAQVQQQSNARPSHGLQPQTCPTTITTTTTTTTTTCNDATYNRVAAVNYATAHTNDCGCSNNYTNYNTLFYNYGLTSNDCQNFVSQSVWYGFGGTNTSTAINGHYYPMVDTGNLATDWWADANTSDGGSTGPWNWANVWNFQALIENNFNNNLIGVQGEPENATAVQIGDYAIDSSGVGHAEFITQAGSPPNWGNIAFSAHTNNHLNYLYHDAYGPTQPSYVQFMQIDTYRQS